MIGTLLVLTALSAGMQSSTGPPAPPPPPSEPQLEIGLYTYRGGDRPSGSTSASGTDPFESTVFGSTTLCGVGGGRGEPPWPPGVAWHVEGQVLGRDGDAFAVRVEWQRLWDHGVRLTDGPKGSSTFTMRLGDSVVLDRATPDAPSPCGVTAARLEAAMLIKRVWPRSPNGTAVGGGGGRGGGAAMVGAVGAAAGGAGGSGVAAGRAGGRGADASGATAPGVPAFDVNMWLVHTRPNGSEESLYSAVRALSTGTKFVFSPVTFAGPKGNITVNVSGILRPMSGAGGTIQLTAQIDRTVHVDSSPPEESGGNSVDTSLVVGPSDVVSFELPPRVDRRQEPAKDLLAGHRFSLRVRIAPVASGKS